MTDKPRGPNRTERLRALSGPQASRALSESQLPAGLPDVLAAWLGRLGLLYGVPFNYLVPDARMLPPESIRFFFVDQDWIDSLVDGAFSIGKGSSRDDVHHEATIPAIRSTTAASARTLRSRLRGQGVEETAANASSGPMTGLLLRSAVVSGWPGLEVKAYDGKNQLNPLRIERLSPDVLIAIFDGVATRIEIDEPPETLHFGLVVDAKKAINLRWLDNAPHRAGYPVTDKDGNPTSVEVVMRKDENSKDTRVLNVRETKQRLENALQGAGQTLREEVLYPADFAIQMMWAPEQQVFEKTG